MTEHQAAYEEGFDNGRQSVIDELFEELNLEIEDISKLINIIKEIKSLQ